MPNLIESYLLALKTTILKESKGEGRREEVTICIQIPRFLSSPNQSEGELLGNLPPPLP